MIMTTELLAKPMTPASRKLRLFSVYVDFPASVYARWAASEIRKLAGPEWQTGSEMWKIDSFKASAALRQMMTHDATTADVIILVVSSLAQPDPALFQWLDSLVAGKTGNPASGLLIGLLGDEKTKTAELDSTVKPLIRCAQQTGREFIWHWMGENSLNDPEWMIDDIKNLLARKLASASGNFSPEAIF